MQTIKSEVCDACVREDVEVYFVERMTPPIIRAVPSFYDFLLKIVLKDLDEYNTFVFEKLTKVHGIVKMQSSFVLSEIKYKTELNIKL